jgi:hypothetical protein
LEGVSHRTVGGGPVAIHSSGQTIFSLAHLEGITLGAGEEEQVAWVWIGGDVGDRTSEGQAAGVFGAGFSGGSLAASGTRGWGIG